ncbi:helix-turn-helix domain-containing protein [Acidiphilium angustum]|uniref:helix-turn-helix domain-containing protein n=1 Tax=Acidiphilium angustum TaxID=523 RepID=UPI00049476DC|nr:helix-turn-helix transcriptional regulator [Acidiphilium angustum]
MPEEAEDPPYSNDPDAIRRRKALKSIMIERDLSAADIARLGNIKANSIYNLFSGRSKSLSTSTLERLAAVIPGVTIAELQGSKTSATGDDPGIEIVAEAQAAIWRDRFELPRDRREKVALPATEGERLAGAFGVRVRRPGAEQVFEDGTILMCIPSSKWEPPLAPGDRVLVQLTQNGRIEVTVHQVVGGTGDELFLKGTSSDPRLNETHRIPDGNRGKPWTVQSGRISIVGVVAAFFSRLSTAAAPERVQALPAPKQPALAAPDAGPAREPRTKKPPTRKASGAGKVKRTRG